jgi:hypothetical protein
VLSILHDNDKMIRMNPIVIAHHRLSDSASAAFFKSEPAAYQSADRAIVIPVYEVTEDTSGGAADGAQDGGGSSGWRGGWAKRFIPDSLTYETSQQCRPDGLLSITHAPMGVHSTTTWVVKEAEGGDGGLVLEERGRVTSNRMLMGFIKTTLQQSHEKLVKDFVALLEAEFAGESDGNVEKVG